MKEVTLIYTGVWATTVEVPDDWELTPSNVLDLADENSKDFNFSDGGADWRLDSAGFETGPELVVD